MTRYRALKIFFVTLCVAVIGFCAVFFLFAFTPTVTNLYGADYTVRQGASIQSVENDLSARQIITHPFLFQLLVRFYNPKHQLKAGEYLFLKNTTPLQMLNQLMTGTGLVQHAFTIIAGWNFHQVRQALNREVLLQHDTQNLTDAEIMNRLGLANVYPEGLFFPDTYYYTSGNSDLTLLKRAYKKMQTALNTEWLNREATVPYATSYTALIAASLIEKEAHVGDERPVIAGVLLNRLRLNMLLQFDPTVIYGMGEKYKGTIYKKDLAETLPYNTYVHKGLPPTPIAMPSLSSINAALHPAHHDYLYFVARGDGRHEFTTSLSAHHTAVTNAKITISKQPYFNSKLVKGYLVPRNAP